MQYVLHDCNNGVTKILLDNFLTDQLTLKIRAFGPGVLNLLLDFLSAQSDQKDNYDHVVYPRPTKWV